MPGRLLLLGAARVFPAGSLRISTFRAAALAPAPLHPGPGQGIPPGDALPGLFGAADTAHCAAFRTKDALQARLAARLLLAQGLASLGRTNTPSSSQALQAWPQLCYTPKGCPSFVSPELAVSFSYAPTPFCLLLADDAANRAPRIGLDCEAVRFHLVPADTFFSKNEHKSLAAASLSKNMLARERLRRWTIKEALAKAHGTGFHSLPPRSLETGPAGRRSGRTLVDGELYSWRCLALPGTFVCVALESAREEMLGRLEVVFPKWTPGS